MLDESPLHGFSRPIFLWPILTRQALPRRSRNGFVRRHVRLSSSCVASRYFSSAWLRKPWHARQFAVKFW